MRKPVLFAWEPVLAMGLPVIFMRPFMPVARLPVIIEGKPGARRPACDPAG
jgi:hypothetical protein